MVKLVFLPQRLSSFRFPEQQISLGGILPLWKRGVRLKMAAPLPSPLREGHCGRKPLFGAGFCAGSANRYLSKRGKLRPAKKNCLC